jgi:hypothetical protein
MLTIAHGTEVAAFDDSSLICTLESKEPEHGIDTSGTCEDLWGHTNGPQWGKEAQNKGVAIWPAIHCINHEISEAHQRNIFTDSS